MNNQMEMPPLSKAAVDSAKDLECEQCNHKFFTPVVCIKRISALMSPNGRDINAPVQTFACAKCGHVNAEFVPNLGQMVP